MNKLEIDVIAEKFGVEKVDNIDNNNDYIVDKSNRMIELVMALEMMESNIEIQPPSVFQSTPFLAPVKNLLKNVISKLMRWYIKPICDEQTKYNQAVYDCIKLIIEDDIDNKGN